MGFHLMAWIVATVKSNRFHNVILHEFMDPSVSRENYWEQLNLNIFEVHMSHLVHILGERVSSCGPMG
jgi:hypothetical protein